VRQSRRPKLGDMLVVTPDYQRSQWLSRDRRGDQYVGIVYEIRLDKWGHQNNVFVRWQIDPPRNYNPHYGYAGTNIHNLRSEFEIIRNGVSIP